MPIIRCDACVKGAEVHRDEAYGRAEIEQLVEAFESGEIPLEEWNHAAHLRIASWYAWHHDDDEAIDRMREGVKHFNRLNDIPQTPDSGYHETLTVFMMKAVNAFVREERRSADLAEVTDALLDSEWGVKEVVMEYYDRDRITSSAARHDYLPPDETPELLRD